MLKNGIGQVVDWSHVDKEDYLLAMERSPIKDVEIKVLLKSALTSETDSRKQSICAGVYVSGRNFEAQGIQRYTVWQHLSVPLYIEKNYNL